MRGVLLFYTFYFLESGVSLAKGGRAEGGGASGWQGGRVTIALRQQQSMENDLTTARGNAVEDLLVLHCGVTW